MQNDRKFDDRQAFDLEQAIGDYRAQLELSGGIHPSDADELENHLREELDALAEVGLQGREAFEHATSMLGVPQALGDEFARGNPAFAWRLPGLFFVAGALISVLIDVVRYVDESFVRLACTTLNLGVVAGSAAHVVAASAPFASALVFGPRFARALVPGAGSRLASPARVASVVGTGLLVMIVSSTPLMPLICDSIQLMPLIRDSIQPLDAGGLRNVGTWAAIDASTHRLLWHAEPLVLAFGMVVARRRVLRGRVESQALFWMLAGLLAHFFWSDLSSTMVNVCWVSSGLSHATPVLAGRTMYAAGLALQGILVVGALSIGSNRIPPPRMVLSASRTDLITLVLGGLCLVLTFRYSLMPKVHLERPVGEAIFHARRMMDTVIDFVVPALLAALLLRFRSHVAQDRRTKVIQ